MSSNCLLGAVPGSRIHAALAQLALARDYARDAGCDPWEFAVEIERLAAMGLTTEDLRWLASKGYVHHARELTRPSDTTRRFCRSRNLSFAKQTCFVLGSEAALVEQVPDGAPTLLRACAAVETARHVPVWDKCRRVLLYDGRIVKRYRVPSSN